MMGRSSRTMVRKRSSVSCWNDRRRFSSKSGESGLTFFSSRRNSHWPAKLLTSASARGSASKRRTWRSSVAGFFSCPRTAASRSSSSGTLLQRKNDKRDDRKSTRLNSSHSQISYAVFCLKKKKKKTNNMNYTYTHHEMLNYHLILPLH